MAHNDISHAYFTCTRHGGLVKVTYQEIDNGDDFPRGWAVINREQIEPTNDGLTCFCRNDTEEVIKEVHGRTN